MGGYSVSSGRGWQINLSHLTIPDNNKLEFLASVVGVLQAFHDNEIPEFGNVLTLTDNSSGLCWLHRNNFDPDQQPIHAEIASKLALTCLAHDFTIHPQHIAGIRNNVADTLSRQHSLTPDCLRQHITSTFPSQVPSNFNIFPLHPEIVSWISSTLALLPSCSTRARKLPTRPPTEHGDAGAPFSPPWISPTTLFSTATPTQLGSSFAEDSSNRSAPDTSAKNHTTQPASDLRLLIHDQYLEGVLKRPLSTWLRNSDTISGRVPFTSRTIPTSSIHPSTHSSRLGKTWTQESDANLPLPQNTSASSSNTHRSPTTPSSTHTSNSS
jgi:hypothetical protein